MCIRDSLEVLDEDVRLRRQLAHQRLPFGLGEVDSHRLLVAVGGEEVRRLAGIPAIGVRQVGRPPGTGVIPRARALDLDHLGAQVGEYLPSPGASQYAGEIEHADMRKGTGHGIT